MSKLDNILGSQYQENKKSIMTRSFVMGNHTFKVIVPTVGETEAMYERLNNPNEQEIEKLFKEKYDKIVAEKNDSDDEVVFKDGDVIIKGRSLKEGMRDTYIAQQRIVEYFKLLVPAEGQSWDGLEYSDIENGMAYALQIELVQNILEAISPSYKDIKTK